MIRRVVNARYEAMVVLTIHSPGGQTRQITTIVDTGFGGALTLPRRDIASLGLPWRTRHRVILANGTVDRCDVHEAIVTWDGQPQLVLIEAAETSPLLGMGLLSGYVARIEVLPEGRSRSKRWRSHRALGRPLPCEDAAVRSQAVIPRA